MLQIELARFYMKLSIFDASGYVLNPWRKMQERIEIFRELNLSKSSM